MKMFYNDVSLSELTSAASLDQEAARELVDDYLRELAECGNNDFRELAITFLKDEGGHVVYHDVITRANGRAYNSLGQLILFTEAGFAVTVREVE